MSTPINLAVTDNFCNAGLSDRLVINNPLSENVTFGTDGFLLSDNLDKVVLGLNISTVNLEDPTDTLYLEDNLDSVTVGLLLSFSDTVTLSDAVAIPGPGVTLSLTDSLSLSDAQIVVADLEGTFSETLTLSDSFASAAPDTVGVGDSTDVLNLSDSITVFLSTGAINLTMQDGIIFTDNTILVLELDYGLVGDTLALSDIQQALEVGHLSPADELFLADLLQIHSPITGFEVTDSLLYTDHLGIEYDLAIGDTTDELHLMDFITLSNIVVDPQVFDTYSLSDSIQVNLISKRVLNLSDSFTLVDTIAPPVVLTDFIDYLRKYLNDVTN